MIGYVNICENKKCFSSIIHKNSRKIVIHDTYKFKDKILKHLNDNDLIFFDDCLYSQYVFLKDNINQLQQKNIVCVISFSSKIYRQKDNKPIYEADCVEYHNKVHNNDLNAFNAYMTLDELRQLIAIDNIYLAGHGAKHLDLQNMNLSILQQTNLFKSDLNEMLIDYKKYNLKTNIFVYPYAYDRFLLADFIVKKNFNFIFAGKNSKRIQFEDILNKTFNGQFE